MSARLGLSRLRSGARALIGNPFVRAFTYVTASVWLLGIHPTLEANAQDWEWLEQQQEADRLRDERGASQDSALNRDGYYPEQSALLNTPGAVNKRERTRDASADGRITARSYLSGDTGQSYDSPTVSISFLETDLKARDLTRGGLSLELDATFILDVSAARERRFGETERFDQIRKLALTQPLGALELSFGRRLIASAGNAWVDGLDLRWRFDNKRSELGIYGGLSPDRFDRSLTLDYQALGLYLATHRTGLDASGAYNVILYQGELDRHFFHERVHWKIAEGLFFSNYLILDLVDDPQITTLLATLDYTPIRWLNFTLSATQYALEQYRNQAIYRDVIEPNQALILGNEVVNLTYQRIRASSGVRFGAAWRQYLMVELKSRAQDGLNAQIYTAGISNSDLFGSRVEVDLRVQVAQQFKTENVIIALTAQRDLSRLLNLNVRLTKFNGETLDQNTDRSFIFSEAQDIYLFGLTLVSRLTKAHQALLAYDGVYESEVADFKSDEPIMIHTLSLSYSYLY